MMSIERQNHLVRQTQHGWIFGDNLAIVNITYCILSTWNRGEVWIYQWSQGTLNLLFNKGHDLQGSSTRHELAWYIHQHFRLYLKIGQETLSNPLSDSSNVDKVGKNHGPRYKLRTSVRSPHKSNTRCRIENASIEFLSIVGKDKSLVWSAWFLIE